MTDPFTVYLTVTDKANLPILGDMTLHFEVDGNQFQANVSVSTAIDFLLGSNWLETNGAKWDVATGPLHFGDRVIHAYRRTLGKVCRQVRVSENYIVPARHEANVPVKMSDKHIPHPTDNWVIQTKQLSSRVMTAWTLIHGKQKRLVARVCNYSDEPYELKADYYLTRIEPVECIPGPGEKLSDECVPAMVLTCCQYLCRQEPLRRWICCRWWSEVRLQLFAQRPWVQA